MSRKKKAEQREKIPAWEMALAKLREGALCALASSCFVQCNNSYPMEQEDWAFVTSCGAIYLNPHRNASMREWEYVLAQCMLHLGLGHFVKERLNDPLWQRACCLAAASFLRDIKLVPVPIAFQSPLPVAVRSAEQAYEQLRVLTPEQCGGSFGTMSGGRSCLRWDNAPTRDYEDKLAESLRRSMRNAMRTAAGLPPESDRFSRHLSDSCMEARDWFLACYPLLGAIAAGFRIVWDCAATRRDGVRIAAVNPQLKEIIINTAASLTREEWKFVLAHEFLHAALRHDLRCEGREPTLWNVACDYVINLWLREMDVGDMPEWVLYDERFRGMTAEAVYDIVCADPRYYKSIALADLLYGDPDWWDKLDGANVDEFYRKALQQGFRERSSQQSTRPCPDVPN